MNTTKTYENTRIVETRIVQGTTERFIRQADGTVWIISVSR